MWQALKRLLDPFHREVSRRVAAFAGALPAHAVVLDAGAGEGQYAPYFRHCRRIGVDLAVGDEGWDYSALDVIGDLHRLPVRTGSMDAFLLVVTLEHLEAPWIAMSELARTLKPGGKGLVVAPFMWELHQEPHDYFRFSPHAIRSLAEKAGLTVRELVPMGGLFRVLHYRIASLLKHALRRPLLLLLLLPFLPALAVYLVISEPVDRVFKLCDHTLGYTGIFEKVR